MPYPHGDGRATGTRFSVVSVLVRVTEELPERDPADEVPDRREDACEGGFTEWRDPPETTLGDWRCEDDEEEPARRATTPGSRRVRARFWRSLWRDSAVGRDRADPTADLAGATDLDPAEAACDLAHS